MKKGIPLAGKQLEHFQFTMVVRRKLSGQYKKHSFILIFAFAFQNHESQKEHRSRICPFKQGNSGGDSREKWRPSPGRDLPSLSDNKVLPCLSVTKYSTEDGVALHGHSIGVLVSSHDQYRKRVVLASNALTTVGRRQWPAPLGARAPLSLSSFKVGNSWRWSKRDGDMLAIRPTETVVLPWYHLWQCSPPNA